MTAIALTTANADLTADMTDDMPIVEKIRRGRLAALAALRARSSQAGNVVSIFENTIETRAAEPVFHSTRSRTPVRAPRLLLTNPVTA